MAGNLTEASTVRELCELVEALTGYDLHPDQILVWIKAYTRHKKAVRSSTELDMAVLKWFKEAVGSEREVSLKDMARKLGVTRERVRQLEARSLRKFLERTKKFREEDRKVEGEVNEADRVTGRGKESES